MSKIPLFLFCQCLLLISILGSILIGELNLFVRHLHTVQILLRYVPVISSVTRGSHFYAPLSFQGH